MVHLQAHMVDDLMTFSCPVGHYTFSFNNWLGLRTSFRLLEKPLGYMHVPA